MVQPSPGSTSGDIIIAHAPAPTFSRKVTPLGASEGPEATGSQKVSPISDYENVNDGSSLVFFERASKLEVTSNMISMCKQGKLSIVLDMIQNGSDVNVKGMFDNTPLIVACQYKQESIALALLKVEGIDIHHANSKGGMALTFACLEGMHDTVEVLLKKGARVHVPEAILYNNITDKNDYISPLSAAVINGHHSIVSILLRSADDSVIDRTFQQFSSLNTSSTVTKIVNRGVTSLMLACKNSHPTIVEMLLKQNANYNMLDSENNNILHYAAKCKNSEAIFLLMKEYNIFSPSLIYAKDSKGDTPLHICCDGKNVESASIILNYLKGKECRNALSVERLNDRHINDNALSGAIQLMVDQAISNLLSSSPENKKYSIKYIPQCCNILGKTPLHYAVKRRSTDLIGPLLKHGFDPDVQDKSGISPRDIAARLPKSSPIFSIIDSYVHNIDPNNEMLNAPATPEKLTPLTPVNSSTKVGDCPPIIVRIPPIKKSSSQKIPALLQPPPSREELLAKKRSSTLKSCENEAAMKCPETNEVYFDNNCANDVKPTIEAPSKDFLTPMKSESEVTSPQYTSGAKLKMVPQYSGSNYEAVTSAPEKKKVSSFKTKSSKSTVLEPPPPCNISARLFPSTGENIVSQ